MSLITEALKKAERERALKEVRESREKCESESALQAVKEAEELVAGDLMMLGQKAGREAAAEEKSAESDLPHSRVSFSVWRTRGFFIVIGVAILIALVLFLIPRWHGSFLLTTPFEDELKRISVETGTAKSRTAAFSPYVLSGITVAGADRYAIINGQVLGVGDWIDGAHVKNILDREVTLDTRSGEIKLKVSA